MAHSLFAPEVRLMLEENDVAGMKAFLETLHPATVADSLAGDLEVDQVWKFLEHTSIRNQAAIFEYFPIEWQVKLVEGTGRERMAHLIEQMSHDDRVDLLRRLSPRVAEGLLRLVDEADRRDIATLYRQTENTAGGLMTTDYAWLPPPTDGDGSPGPVLRPASRRPVKRFITSSSGTMSSASWESSPCAI